MDTTVYFKFLYDDKPFSDKCYTKIAISKTPLHYGVINAKDLENRKDVVIIDVDQIDKSDFYDSFLNEISDAIEQLTGEYIALGVLEESTYKLKLLEKNGPESEDNYNQKKSSDNIDLQLENSSSSSSLNSSLVSII